MIEVANIFQKHGEEYRAKHKCSAQMLKTMYAVKHCRTSVMGGHIDECNKCGHQKISYNSCRNRHCPKCQNLPKERWLEERKKDVLTVPYFHVVFTIPNELRALTLQNKKVIYSILFKSSSETLLELARDPKYLGAQIGFISLLHTWGQNLMDHPHIHSIVTGGGLSDNEQWVDTKKKFFIPVRVMSRLFRGKFMYYLNLARERGKLRYYGSIQTLEKERGYQRLQDELFTKEWVIYCKPPFQCPEHVLNYLGRYTHKVAISNHRILKLEEGKVSFSWRDYSDGNRKKIMTLCAQEFIRRYMLHILPRRFVKIRHYGILSNRNRENKLKECKMILGNSIEEPVEKESWSEFLLKITGKDYTLCPCCSKGKLIEQRLLRPQCCSPPEKIHTA